MPSNAAAMESPILIAPSLLAADIMNLSKEIRDVEVGGADIHHIDVMDGHFVENLTFGPGLIRALKTCTAVPLDVHIMVANPDHVATHYLDAGADLLTFHVEATAHAHRIVTLIRDHGKLPGIAVNPATPVEQVFPLLDELHHVLLMSVNPGFGGQGFIPHTADKCRVLATELARRGLDQVKIQVDGGINHQTIGVMAEAGARFFVAGSAIYGHKDRTAAITDLRQAAIP